MKTELKLPRELTVRSGDSELVVRKNGLERIEHMLMKVFIWHLYLPSYPEATIGSDTRDRNRPDVVALDTNRSPILWGEAGKVRSGKIESLIQRYPRTHLVVGKWDIEIDPSVELVRDLLKNRKDRTAPVDLIRFPDSVAYGGIDVTGRITLQFSDVECVRLGILESNVPGNSVGNGR